MKVTNGARVLVSAECVNKYRAWRGTALGGAAAGTAVSQMCGHWLVKLDEPLEIGPVGAATVVRKTVTALASQLSVQS